MTAAPAEQGVTLFLESTSGAHSALVVAADGRQERLRREWTRAQSRQDNVDDLLDELGPDGFAALGRVVVDAGPGNLAATRACVAYANALAYSLGCELGSVDSLEVMTHAWGSSEQTVVACRRAGPHGLYTRTTRPGSPPSYAVLDPAGLAGREDDAVVLYVSDGDAEVLARAGVDPSRCRKVMPTVDAVREVWAAGPRRGSTRVVEPVTEQGGLFHGAS